MVTERVRYGTFRHAIEILRATKTDDQHGGHSNVWTAIHRLSADVEQLRGGEELLFAGERAVKLYRIRTRYRSDEITEDDRVLWKGRTFEIIDVENLGEESRFVALTVSEIK